MREAQGVVGTTTKPRNTADAPHPANPSYPSVAATGNTQTGS
jgi:hypothetical protein